MGTVKSNLVEVVVTGRSQIDVLERGLGSEGVKFIQLNFLHSLGELLHLLLVLSGRVDVHVDLRLDLLLRGPEGNAGNLLFVLHGLGLLDLQLVQGVLELHFGHVETAERVFEVVTEHLQLGEHFVVDVVEDFLVLVELRDLLNLALGLADVSDELHHVSDVEVAF